MHEQETPFDVISAWWKVNNVRFNGISKNTKDEFEDPSLIVVDTGQLQCNLKSVKIFIILSSVLQMHLVPN